MELTLALVAELVAATDPLDRLTDHWLPALGLGLGVDRAVAVLRPTAEGGAGVQASWTRPDGPLAHGERPAGQEWDRLAATWQCLDGGQTVAITDVTVAGDGWEADQAVLEACGVRAAVRTPVGADGQTFGALGVDLAGRARRWTDEELSTLRLVASALGGALARQQAAAASSLSDRRFRDLVEALPDPVVRLDTAMRATYGNEAARALGARWRSGATAETVDEPHDTLAQAYHRLSGVFRSGRAETFQSMLVLDDGEHWFEVTAVPEFDAVQRVVAVLTVSRDITTFKAREDELVRRALEDPLTGLANRSRFEAELERALQGLGRDRGPVGVLFLDLDGFKDINDRRGHAVGDRFLRAFAERLAEAVRPSDLVARVGGDEFVVLPDRLRILAELHELAERLHEVLAEPLAVDGEELAVTVSIGLAAATRRGQVHGPGLLDRADRAMYRAKARGPGQTAVWTGRS